MIVGTLHVLVLVVCLATVLYFASLLADLQVHSCREAGFRGGQDSRGRRLGRISCGLFELCLFVLVVFTNWDRMLF